MISNLSNDSSLFNGLNAAQDSKCPTLKSHVTKIMKYLAYTNSKLYFSTSFSLIQTWAAMCLATLINKTECFEQSRGYNLRGDKRNSSCFFLFFLECAFSVISASCGVHYRKSLIILYKSRKAIL